MKVSFYPGKRDGNQRCGQLMMKWGQSNANIHKLQSKSLAKKRHTCTTAWTTISKRACFVPRAHKLSEQCTVASFYGDARRATTCKWWKVNTNLHTVSINDQLVHATAYLIACFALQQLWFRRQGLLGVLQHRGVGSVAVVPCKTKANESNKARVFFLSQLQASCGPISATEFLPIQYRDRRSK